MSLHFHRSGSGEPLLMLHGLFGSWENLGGPIKALQQQFDVIAPDMLNHGRSPHVDQFNYTSFADSVLALADQLGLQKFHLLGHSMGGKIAMELALKHPERVSRLIVVDIAPVQYPHHHADVFKGLKQVPLDEIKSRTEADHHLSQHIDSASIRAFLLKNLYRTDTGFDWRMNVEALEREYDQIASPMSDGEYLGPTLFIKGSESNYIKPEYQNEVVKRFPKVQLRIIEGTGHWPHAEKPALFTKIVERFLQP